MAHPSEKIVLSFAVAVFISFGCTECRTYFNSFDGRLDRECSGTKAISSVYSYHDNKREDRRFGFDCRHVPYASGERQCYYPDNWVNDYDEELSFHCPPNLFIVGMESVHNNQKEDRIWKFKCCGFGEIVLNGCKATGWTNNFDGEQNYHVPSGHVITGVFSYHHNRQEDRRYKYIICKVGK